MTLQNLELDGKNVRFNWIKPFDTIANYASRQLWLPLVDLFRNQKIEFELSLSDMKILFENLELNQPRRAFAN